LSTQHERPAADGGHGTSSSPGQQGAHAGAQAGAPAGEPSEEELRAAYEAELSRLSAIDVMAQAAVSLLNLGATRLAPAGAGAGEDGPGGAQRDLEQARDAIDAVRALLEILERRIPQELAPMRDALSRLQMAYAREVASAEAGAGAGHGQPAARDRPPGQGAPTSGQPGEQPNAGERQRGPGPAESSGRLWVPGR
jgi:hypothetical protein